MPSLNILPSPADLPPIMAHDEKTGEVVHSQADRRRALCGLGLQDRNRSVRGQPGILPRLCRRPQKAAHMYITRRKGQQERVGRIVRMHANDREEVDEIYSGEIAAIVGLKSTTTGDTLCDPDHPVILEKITFPEPVIGLRIEPKTKADQEKMGTALHRLAEEDPTFRVAGDNETGETIISGMGELHLEIHR